VSSGSGRDPVHDYETVDREQAAYNPDLATRPQIVVATKIDVLDDQERLAALKQRAEADGKSFYAISSVTNKGVRDLVNAVAARLDELTEAARQNEAVQVSF
jgi:GTP-binding protein